MKKVFRSWMEKMNHKPLLRIEALQILTNIDSLRRKNASQAAFSFFTEHCKKTSQKVLSFASKPLEIDLWPLNEWLMKHKRLFLPKIENRMLVPYEVSSLNDLVSSNFGLKEPGLNCKKASLEEIDLVLVPGLCFDEHLHRVGYGKGYFDKFLSLIPQAVKWGVGFTEQKVHKISHETHDILLDGVLLF